MITDAQLRKAAEKSSDLYLRYIERDYNSTPSHEFSASFEKKIRKLRKRADHPYFYKTLHKAAAVILAILISGSAWLAVDTEARAAFFGWVREIYETYFVYRFAKDDGKLSEDVLDPVQRHHRRTCSDRKAKLRRRKIHTHRCPAKSRRNVYHSTELK